MRFFESNRNWMTAVVVGLSVGAAAVGLAQKQPELNAPVVAHNEHALSTIFRDISKDVLPSIVSIETRGKGAQLTSGAFDEEDNPFEGFFGNDPRFKELFKNRQRGQQRPAPMVRGQGSGFIIDASGIVMTNAHVVRDAEEVKVRLADGREFIGTDVKADPRTDVAIVRLQDAKDLKALPLGNSDQMEIGDWVLAVGSPFGLELSVTHGIISAKGRGPGIAEREDFLQTDAPINPGNSGGPLLNLKGEVIGINTAISTRSGGSQGVGFTIPINMARWVADQLTANGVVKRAFLGVSMQPLDHVLAKKFGVEAGHGVLVNQIVPGSPAAEAKVQAGDVLVELNGQKIANPHQLQGIVEQLAVGKTYPLVVQRDGEKVTLQITGREMPNDYSRRMFEERLKNEDESSKKEETGAEGLGLKVRDISEETAKQFGLADTKGVVVTSVAADSPAGLVGVRTGDVVLEVNRNKITSTEDFTAAMKDASVKDGVLMLVKSGRGTRYLSIQSR